MADPLSQLADRTVPERTNFFDPAESQTLISRYGNARMGRESAKELASAADRFSRLRDDDLRLERDRITWAREDQDYADRKEAEAQRGVFLRTLSQIDPTAEDYNAQITRFYASLPQELANDDAVRSVVGSMNNEADDARRRRGEEAANERMRDRQMAMFTERQKANAGLRGVTPEMVRKYTLPDGSLDPMIYYEAGKMERENKAGEFDRRQKLMLDNRLKLAEAMDLSRSGRGRRVKVEKWMAEDRGAFPRRVDVLLEDSGKKSLDLLKGDPKFAEEFRQADAWDKNLLQRELSAAYAYDTPDAYIDLVPGLTESQRERRRMVWEHAHNDGAIVETGEDAPDEAPASGFQKTKTLNGKTYGFDGKGWKLVAE